jgi:glycosyltransferase involved in cell wall biosynthesis
MTSKAEQAYPKISIITPSFNQGKYIKRTIESVLTQQVPGVEHLVFDAGSGDETLEVLRSFDDSVYWVSETDKGQADAVNKGLRAAKGEIIGWLNSDDIYYPDAFRVVLDFFKKNPEVDILYGLADHIDDSDNVIEPYYTEAWNYERLKEICFICQPAVFFRKSIIDSFGLLDKDLRYCMDYEYWLRIGREKPFYFLKQKLAGSRLYQNTKTLGSAAAVHEEILKMFKNKFGKIPSKWIYNHAHIIAREAGLKRETSEENMRFVKKLISVSIADSLRLRHYIPLSELKTIIGWYAEARKR